jgi:hypothetical protein
MVNLRRCPAFSWEADKPSHYNEARLSMASVSFRGKNDGLQVGDNGRVPSACKLEERDTLATVTNRR